MAAGQLRDRIAFKSPSYSNDGMGGGAVTWATQFTVWGSLTPERGREQLEAGRLQSAVAGVVKVRSSTAARTITAEWICTIDGVDYNIRSITNPDRHDRYLELLVERGVAI